MDLYSSFREKLDQEIKEFRSGYQDKCTSAETYEDWHVIAFMEEYYDMFLSVVSAGVTRRFDDNELKWLASFEAPLDNLYQEWMKKDEAMNHDWDVMIDFVHTAYGDHNRREIQNAYRDIKALNINPINDRSDDYFTKYNFVTHISPSPFVFSHKFPNDNFPEANKVLGEFFRNRLNVRSCDYGCDTYPNGLSSMVGPDNKQTYQQPVWNFIAEVDELFNCKCNYFDSVNGFEFIFEFGSGDNQGCYVLSAGNNGQEFVEGLYFNNPEQLSNPEFLKAVETIDRALYILLEKNELCMVSKERGASLEDKISQADLKKEALAVEGYPTIEEIRKDYASLMEKIEDVRTVEDVKEFCATYPWVVEINGDSVDEFLKSGGTDADIEWIRYETFGCLSYIYDRFDGKPMFDVFCSKRQDEFIHDITIDKLTEENYKKWVQEDIECFDRWHANDQIEK